MIQKIEKITMEDMMTNSSRRLTLQIAGNPLRCDCDVSLSQQSLLILLILLLDVLLNVLVSKFSLRFYS